MVVETRLAVRRHRREAGGHGDDVAVVRAAVLTVADRHEAIHHVAPAAEHAERETAADRLAQRAKVRGDTEIFLRSASAHAERAQYLVEEQKDAGLARSPPQRIHEVFIRYDAAGVVIDRFAHDGSQLMGVPA